MGQCVEDLVRVMECLLAPRAPSDDPFTPQLPLRRAVLTDTTPLRIGFYTTDGYFQPAPACVRATGAACVMCGCVSLFARM